jgi:hypothetical protein
MASRQVPEGLHSWCSDTDGKSASARRFTFVVLPCFYVCLFRNQVLEFALRIKQIDALFLSKFVLRFL